MASGTQQKWIRAMAFTGTQQKCKVCEKTVYLVDQLTADGVAYHRACFRCHHCKRTLNLSDYSSFEGVPYCKAHFPQLLKSTGSFRKSFDPSTIRNSFDPTQSIDKGENELKPQRETLSKGKAFSKAASIFLGTQEKCVACGKTVYPLEKVSVEGSSYHKSCFKCLQGGCSISPSNFAALEGRLYCKHHFKQLFKEKGNYSQLLKLPSAKPSGHTEA